VEHRLLGTSGIEVSELLPHIAGCVDDICVIRSMVADNINHGGAALQMNTGEQAFSRPSIGAWATYGLGSENENLPGFIVSHAHLSDVQGLESGHYDEANLLSQLQLYSRYGMTAINCLGEGVGSLNPKAPAVALSEAYLQTMVLRITPEIQRDSLLPRNTAAIATSQGVPSVPRGTTCRLRSRCAGSRCSVNVEWRCPGAMQLARIPSRPCHAAVPLVSM